jgi:hypothetical protein
MSQKIDDPVWNLAQVAFACGRYPEFHKRFTRLYSDDGRHHINIVDELPTIASIELTMRRGMESGLKPLTALYNIVWFNDRPCIWGDAALALVMNHPSYKQHTETYDKETGTASCIVYRQELDPVERTFSWDDAQRAELTKLEHYRRYPERMLQMRARIWALRDAFADAFSGLSIAEEQQDVEYMAAAGKDYTPPAKPKDEEIDEFTRRDLETKGETPAPDFNSLKDGAPISMVDKQEAPEKPHKSKSKKTAPKKKPASTKAKKKKAASMKGAPAEVQALADAVDAAEDPLEQHKKLDL